MSALGHEQTSRHVRVMSVIRSKSHSSARFGCPLSANTGRSWYALLAPAAHAASPVPPAPPVPAMAMATTRMHVNSYSSPLDEV
jgi:hypothetical protein